MGTIFFLYKMLIIILSILGKGKSIQRLSKRTFADCLKDKPQHKKSKQSQGDKRSRSGSVQTSSRKSQTSNPDCFLNTLPHQKKSKQSQGTSESVQATSKSPQIPGLGK